MATWKIEPTWKKSIVERSYWTKGDKTITNEIGWRWGSFTVETEGDDPPEIDEDTDLFNADFELSDFETSDGCWEENEYDGFEDEEEEEMDERLSSGDISIYDLEEEGWMFGDGEFIIDCDMEIVRIDDEGNEIGEKITTESEEEPEANTDIKLTPTAKWPFGN